MSRRYPSAEIAHVLRDSWLADLFLPALTPLEMAAIEQRLESLVVAAEETCEKWTFLNPATIVPLTIHTIVHLASLPVESILLRIKLSLWTWALDDVLDKGTLT